MKKVLVFLFALGIVAANAQSARTDESLEARSERRLKETKLELRVEKPNEITAGRLTLEGITVQAAKTHDFLQLINPFASEKYGSAEDNVARDPIDGKVTGLKIFSIKF